MTGRHRLITGDSLEELRRLPDASVDMCVTSPPYWGLRDYGVEGQLGLERTLGEHIAAMVTVFEEVRRIVKPHGSLWLNYGDCYATSPNGRSAAATKAEGADDRTFSDKPFSTVGAIYVDGYEKTARCGSSNNRGNVEAAHGGRIVGHPPESTTFGRGFLKPRDLCMIPNRLAIALQDAGWWVRSEIVWGKPNAMPDSSGVYRPSVAHEKIFLLTKSGGEVWRARDTGEISFFPNLDERCPLVTKPDRTGPRWIALESWYDASAVRMPPAEASIARWAQDVESQAGSERANAGRKTNGPMKAVGGPRPALPEGRPEDPRVQNPAEVRGRIEEAMADGRISGRLLRNYEPDLTPVVPGDVLAIEPPDAAAPDVAPGIVPAGARVAPEVWDIPTASYAGAHFATFPPALVAPCIMAGCPKDGTVLDPFGGAGTTALVAERLGRRSILIEINPDYVEIARLRLRSGNARARPAAAAQPLGLFAGLEAAE